MPSANLGAVREGPGNAAQPLAGSIFEGRRLRGGPVAEEAAAAAEVTEIAERAEGVLQLGASGPKIPLYGRWAATRP